MSLRRRPNWKREKLAWAAGELVCGVDEVGTGAWAGPVYAGAAIFPSYVRVPKLMDSKLLREDERMFVAEFLMKHCVWAIGRAEVSEISALGLRPATYLAMRRAIASLSLRPTRLIIDALRIPDLDIPQESVIRGDYQVASISAAAIIAKYHRDAVMREYDAAFPGYGFADHKGYGTKCHQDGILRLGPCSIHRLNFAPFSKKEP
jgi:ribonuclease HII